MPEPFAADVEFNKLRLGQDDIELVGAMLELAGDAYPQLDRGACRREILRLQTAAENRAVCADSLSDRLAAISKLLYVEEGFRGNREAYYDPRNSYLNEVLERRCGIPITLGILYMAVAAGARVPVRGVPTPGHFMLMVQNRAQQWFIDPFDSGEVLDLQACRSRLETMLGQRGAAVDEDWFRPATNLEIVVRVLRNLKAAYAMDDRWREAIPVQKRLLALLPDNLDEKRDLALIHLRTGQPHAALELLQQYLDRCDDEAARLVQPYLRTARKIAAELN